MKSILKYLIWFGIYSVLAVPFFVSSGMFFPFITGKAFAFRIITEIIFGLWLILIMKDREFRSKWSWIFGSVIALVFILLIANINAMAPYKAFWSNFERMEGWVTFIHLLGYFTVLSSMLNTEARWLWFLRANILAGTVLGIQSLAEGAKEEVIRIAGPLGNPIYIAVYFLFMFFFTLILLYKDVLVRKLTTWIDFRKVFANALFYVYIGVSILSLFIVYRASRGALLGAVGGIFLGAILIAIFEKEKKVMKQLALGVITVMVAVLVIFFSAKDTQFVKNNFTLSRLAEISWSNTEGNARQMVWPMALKGFQEKPILGWGQDGFNYVFNKYYDPRMYGQESWFDRAHNAPLDFLIAGGLLGLLSYLALFISVLYLLWLRSNRLDITEKALLTALLGGYFFQGIFVFDNNIGYILFFTTLAYVHARLTNEGVMKVEISKGALPVKTEGKSYILTFIQNEEYQNYLLIPAVIILTTVGVWYINVPAIKANLTLINALRSVQSGLVPQGLESFKSALSYKSLGDSEIREQLLSYTPNILKSASIDNQIKQEFNLLTLTELDKQITRVPEDARYYILLGSYLDNIGNPDKALPYITKAVELSPKKQAMKFVLIQTLYRLGKVDEAFAVAKEAYELDTNYAQARDIYKEITKWKMSVQPGFKTEGEALLKSLDTTI